MDYIQKHCALCGVDERVEELYSKTFQDDDLTPAVFSARRVADHFHYKMVRCRQCGLVFSRDVLDEDYIWSLYVQSEFTFGEYTPVLKRDYWTPIEPHLGALPNKKVLE